MYTWGIKDFHKCWLGPLAKRRLCLGPAGVINCAPLSAFPSEWVCFPESMAITAAQHFKRNLLLNLYREGMQLKKQQSKLDTGQQTGSKSGKEYVKAVYCLKESFGPRKENNSLKGPLLNHQLQRKQSITLVPPWCSGPVASIWDLSAPVWEPTTPYTWPEDLSPPAQLQMASQQNNTQNIPPDWHFPYHFHKPPYKFEASLIPLGAQPGR